MCQLKKHRGKRKHPTSTRTRRYQLRWDGTKNLGLGPWVVEQQGSPALPQDCRQWIGSRMKSDELLAWLPRCRLEGLRKHILRRVKFEQWYVRGLSLSKERGFAVPSLKGVGVDALTLLPYSTGTHLQLLSCAICQCARKGEQCHLNANLTCFMA